MDYIDSISEILFQKERGKKRRDQSITHVNDTNTNKMATDPSIWEVEAGQLKIRGQIKGYLRPYLTRTKNTQTKQ